MRSAVDTDDALTQSLRHERTVHVLATTRRLAHLTLGTHRATHALRLLNAALGRHRTRRDPFASRRVAS